MSCSDMLCCRFDVRALIVEEEIGPERAQKLSLVETAEKERLVDADVPRAQSPDHARMCRGGARGDERRADQAAVLQILGLDLVQRG